MAFEDKTRVKPFKSVPKVCIVGAGISGLRCADILLQHGFDITILEARNRIGGRAHQSALPNGHLVDLGPNWIHGTDGNPILDIAKEIGAPTHIWEDSLSYLFDEDGKLLEDGLMFMEALWRIVAEATKYSAQNTSRIDPDKSLKDFFKEKMIEVFPDEKDMDKRIILMQMAEMWGPYVGSPVETQSLKFFWLEESINGENLFCAGTYKKILARIANPALSNAKVELSTKVTRVEARNNDVTITTDKDNLLDFDEVVITIPLGWLQRNKDIFDPPLPERFAQAVDAIGYGCLEKVYITFPRAFWLGEEGNPDKEPFTGFINWLSPSYARETNPKRWNQMVVDLATLPGSCAHPTLLFYLYGYQSISLASELSALPSQTERDKYIYQFFKPYFSRLPHYKENLDDCLPASCIATAWVLDEYAGWGSYSTYRTGLQEGDKDIEIMREGLPERGIWFAGEHTSPFIALGTVTGAYWSGENIGKRIVDVYSKVDGAGERLR